MLEVHNLYREYKPKKGRNVIALNHISLKFPEKGMVIILGKSGSGKSTLLNVLGGLDKADDGEIIIKGKSSKDFSQSDFDSYRNTYLGFIFQEYNILEEFTVGANIGLALQLQGKKSNDEAIAKILKEVDLEGYGNRKPNELSGGQKQRVAIARALVKDPEIIMADEPTGALDSHTGIQVFDTLKKLAENKLVVVVTHDREFAELYGNRVIEFKDGNVISDIEKYLAPSKVVNPNINVVDDKIIQIKQGYKLSTDDISMINKYLENNNAIVSIDQDSNDNLKKIARIDDNGNKESFKTTDESTINISDNKNFKLIKSHLPFRNSFKIGASSLKSKPIRLIVTILLSVVAFTLFGLADTVSAYNKYTTTTNSFSDNNLSAISFVKNKKSEMDWYGDETCKQTDEDIAYLNKQTGLDFKPVLEVKDSNFTNFFYETPNSSSSDSNKILQADEFSGYFEMTQSDIDNLGYSLVGKLPTNDNEIAISDYLYQHFKQNGYKTNSIIHYKATELDTTQKFLAKNIKLSLDNQEYLVVGIIDTKFDYDHYKSLNDSNSNSLITSVLGMELFTYLSTEHHTNAFVNDGFIDSKLIELKNRKGIYFDDSRLSLDPYDYSDEQSFMRMQDGGYTSNLTITKMVKPSDISDFNTSAFFINNEKTSLGNNEILISVKDYTDWAINYYYYCEQTEHSFTQPQWMNDYQMAYNEVEQLNIIKSSLNAGTFFVDGIPDTLYYNKYSSATEIKIVGVTNSNDLQENGNIVASGDFYNTFDKTTGYYQSLIAALPNNKGTISKLVKFGYDNEETTTNGMYYKMSTSAMLSIEIVNSFSSVSKKVFLYIGIGFALFSALLMMNFISTSIAYKRREIGILRAVGARSADVFGIFANESLIIALINFVFATISTGIITAVINNTLRTQSGIMITMFNMGLRQIGLILGISVVIALVASFIPVFKIARQKPVDAMNKR
ncbi:MAG: ATP-binding cassette domain-containing protein [Clostridia bacterium]